MFLFFLYTCSDWYKLCFRNCVVWMGSRWCNRITFNPSQLESVQAFLLGLVQISSYEWQNNYCFQTMIYKINIIVLCIWRQSMPFVYLSIFQFSVSAMACLSVPGYLCSLRHTVMFLKKDPFGSGGVCWVSCIDVVIVSFSLLFLVIFFEFTNMCLVVSWLRKHRPSGFM